MADKEENKDPELVAEPQADGSVKIPEVLQKYMPGNIDAIKSKGKN